ncbi:MAG: glycogen debranching enzyme [Actinomycetota bacterium]
MGGGNGRLERRVRVRAPGAASVAVTVTTLNGDLAFAGVPDAEGWWSADVHGESGDLYAVAVDGGAPVLDPNCLDLVMTADGPRSVLRAPWAVHPQGEPLAEAPVVYELHVKGFGGSYSGCIGHLDHVVSVGANVIELMPVHPFDDRDNYWGYMPLVWGAVHRGYATEPTRAAEELAELVAAAHERGVHVWIDVVFNHTGEDHPPSTARGLRHLDRTVYRGEAEGSPTNDSGCGNDIEPGHPWVRELVVEALDRYADLGVDGFRFDLASLLSRDGGGLVTRITEWAQQRGVVCVAEPWDMGGYQLGRGWPWPTWLQWNDRFRDQVRGFLRGEPGLVRAVKQRVQGSPDLLGPDGAVRSLNFITAHDGLTMHDLTTVDHDGHHAWNCGPELRLQQLKNYFAMLLLSAGTPMWVMGDEFGRTQRGHDNPYDIDGPLTRVDWSGAAAWADLTDFVRELVAVRRRHSLAAFRFHGVGPSIDEGYYSRSIAWCAGDLYVMVNAWWEPLTFEVHEPGDWRVVLCTAEPQGLTLAPRSVVVLER